MEYSLPEVPVILFAINPMLIICGQNRYVKENLLGGKFTWPSLN